MKKQLRALVVLSAILGFAVTAMHLSQKTGVVRDVAMKAEPAAGKAARAPMPREKREKLVKRLQRQATKMGLEITDAHAAELLDDKHVFLLEGFEVADSLSIAMELIERGDPDAAMQAKIDSFHQGYRKSIEAVIKVLDRTAVQTTVKSYLDGLKDLRKHMDEEAQRGSTLPAADGQNDSERMEKLQADIAAVIPEARIEKKWALVIRLVDTKDPAEGKLRVMDQLSRAVNWLKRAGDLADAAKAHDASSATAIDEIHELLSKPLKLVLGVKEAKVEGTVGDIDDGSNGFARPTE